ncbi:MAG: hypothetical protein AAFZ52_09010 [Bacteroidota bacterium]
MGNFNTYCCSIVYILLLAGQPVIGQGNCLVYPAESGERLACELSYRAVTYKQGSKESQDLFDAAIRIGPKYAWAYYEKSVPFFKRGLLAEGVSLINKAIELEPQNYLSYRAYWYFQHRSYPLCIEDLEELYGVHDAFFVSVPGGELEMRILLAFAYAQTGNLAKGITWMQHLMERTQGQPALKGYYDHFALGLLYYENDQFTLAKAELVKQLELNDRFADTYYYLGRIADQKADAAAAQAYYRQALACLNGEGGGYSLNLFPDRHLKRGAVEERLNDRLR